MEEATSLITAETPACPYPALQDSLRQLDASRLEFDQADKELKQQEADYGVQQRAWHTRNEAAKRFTQAWDQLTPYGTIFF